MEENMLEEEEEDLHLCYKCNATIIGLDNYITHRKSNCVNKTTSLNRDIVQVDHSYGTYDFTETNVVKDVVNKGYNFNYDIQHTNTDTNQDDKQLQNEQTKSITDSYGYNYGLGADIFFSSLELQSSNKKSLQNVDKIPSGNRVLTRKATAAILATHHDHDVDWIETPTEGDKLMKAVNDISGNTKKVDAIFNLIEFHQDSGESSDESEEDDEEDYDAPPRTHTGGKWKPESPVQTLVHQWDFDDKWISVDDDGNDDDNNDDDNDDDEMDDNDDVCNNETQPTETPITDYTQHLWTTNYNKLTEPIIEKSFTEQFWCNICNRKLASRLIYERHLKSNLHLKRAQPENELDEASRQIASASKRSVKPSVYLNEQIYTTDYQRPKRNVVKPVTTATVTSGALKLLENHEEIIPKRKRLHYFIKCDICKTRLPTYLFGKHLISHYHYRRMLKQPDKSFQVILDNIDKIVRQSPFQCQSCHFYANTEETFMRHWNSIEHAENTSQPGRFWCNFCRTECVELLEMTNHLLSLEHQETVFAINRSVPIIIRKKTILRCDLCLQEFRYNIELRHHTEKQCNAIPTGTASNAYQSKFLCDADNCHLTFQSRIALQKHQTKVHNINQYFCSPCHLTFSSPIFAKKHRTTTEHKISVSKKNSKVNLVRSCEICHELLDDILKLKEHLMEKHPEHKHNCPLCGEQFLLPQEVSRHVRDKKCRLPILTPVHLSVDNTIFIGQEEPIHYATIEIENNDNIKIQYIQIKEKDQIMTEIPSTSSSQNIIEPTNSEIDSTVMKPPIEIPNSELTIVQQNPDEKQQWNCKSCSFSSPLQAEWLFHEILHTVENIGKDMKISCPYCNKMFGKKSLRLHLRQHTNERIFKCELCKMSFTRKSSLNAHIGTVHEVKNDTGEPRKEFICSICEKKFKKRNILEQHLHIHRNEVVTKRYHCHLPDCIYSGRNRAELRNHLLIHSDQFNFICKEPGCNYKGKTKEYLTRHYKKHKNERNYHCKTCSSSFKILAHLKRHELIHSAQKPYLCPISNCNYSCNLYENLRKHVLTTAKHRKNNKTLYECKHCEKIGSKYGSNFLKDYKVHLFNQHNLTED